MGPDTRVGELFYGCVAWSAAGEVPRVLFLGIYLVFHYFPGLILFPQRVFNLDRGSVPQALVEPFLIPPMHPLKRLDLHLDNIAPSPGMDQLLF